MKSASLLSFCLSFSLLWLLAPTLSVAQSALNVSLFGTLNPIPVRYSGCWGWTSPSGAEYAILGGFEGTHLITIDDSLDVRQLDFVDGQNSNWREITVIGDHAFVVTEGGGDLQGMQVIDLSPLPDSVHLVTSYTQTFTRGHIISRDLYSDSAYVYISGTSTTGGVHILDVSNPENPLEVGLYNPPYYIHDSHIRGNLMFASALSVGLDIVDIANPSSPTLVGHIDHASQFTHSTWTTEELTHVIVTDEVDGLPMRIWNIEDIQNPFEVSQYSANLQSLVHNPYVLGDLVFLSHNTEGLRVVDIADPSVPVEVGYYDTYSGASGGFSGLWSAYPYFPSGRIIGGNREDGLHIWTFNGTRAGRIYGLVLDSLTGDSVSGATVSILETGRSTVSDAVGSFRIGELPSNPPGYTIQVMGPPGYPTLTISSVTLEAGDSLWLEIHLPPATSSADGDSYEDLRFSIEQNYPNPFNPQTTIVFGIGSRQPVELKVFDLLGQEAATLVHEVKDPGVHSVTWDATGFPSGVYLCVLRGGSGSTTRKLILAR